MKKKRWILIIAVVILLAILFIPIPKGTYKDGGTKEYVALTYKIVDWNRLIDDGIYEQTKIYFGSNRNKNIDELWELELDNVEQIFIATILEINDDTVLVEPVEGQMERTSSDKISFSTTDLGEIDVKEGSVVQITYTGGIRESYPAQIDALRWKICNDLRHMEYTDEWIDKATARKDGYGFSGHLYIEKIYSDCFFARNVIPLPYQIKLNGSLSDEWCVGDKVYVTYDNIYYDEEKLRYEADLLTIEESDLELDPNAGYKPVIYLYPEEETEVSVNLTLNGELTCTYPAYNDGWNVTALPDGTLTDEKGQTYNYLYWEGETYNKYDLSKGFCVKGEDTATFLEEALEKLGLTRREANEFIVYWLPLMEKNPYNIISFQTDIYTDAAKLDVSPAPDTMIRVFMTWQKADTFVELPKQELTAPERKGFTVVEWGGTEIK